MQATYGSFLVATRLDQYMARPGATVTLSARTLDYTGAARPDVPVRVLVERLDYRRRLLQRADRHARSARRRASTDAAGQLTTPVRVPERPGNYRVAVVAREGQRDLRDDAWLWVPGPSETPASTDNQYLELLADKRSYAPGDTARIVVRGRDIVGPVLLTKEGQRVSWHQVVRPTVAGAFEIPVTDGDLGDVYVNVVLLRDGRLLQSERRLAVPPVSRTLQIALTADRPVAKPQEPASFAVQVTDAAGQPVRASVSLAVIDESVFGVKADDTPDPARVFYRREYSRVSTAFSRDYHFMGHSGTEQLRLASRRRRPLSLADFKADRLAQPQVRKEFPDAIHWVASLVTDGDGARPHRRALSRFAHDVAADRPRRHHRHAGRRRRRPDDDDQGPDRPAGDAAVPDRGRRRCRRRPSSTTTSTPPARPASRCGHRRDRARRHDAGLERRRRQRRAPRSLGLRRHGARAGGVHRHGQHRHRSSMRSS